MILQEGAGLEMFTWETDFYTPPVLRGAALFNNAPAAVYTNPVP